MVQLYILEALIIIDYTIVFPIDIIRRSMEALIEWVWKTSKKNEMIIKIEKGYMVGTSWTKT